MKFTIDRETWMRGDTRLSYLLSSVSKKKCCLGFCSLALGYTEEEILDLKTPWKATDVNNKNLFPKTLIYNDPMTDTLSHSELCWQLMRCNDGRIAEHEREAMIQELFAQAGLEVEFIN